MKSKKMSLLLKSNPKDKETYAFDVSLNKYRRMTWEDFCNMEGERLVMKGKTQSAEVREDDKRCSLWVYSPDARPSNFKQRRKCHSGVI